VRVLADAKVAGLDRLLRGVAELASFSGDRPDPQSLARADALVVRSVTRVGAALLEGTPVRIVASATAGIDHVDVAGLRGIGVEFHHAPGANARAVAEHVLAVLLAEGVGPGAVVGVVGLGAVGSRLAAACAVLGLRVIASDPPREARGETAGPATWLPLADLLEAADVVSLHVPLEHEPPHATRNLLGPAQLGRLRPGALLVQTSRGGVMDETALLDHDVRVAIDTWAGEPSFAAELVAGLGSRLRFATPHVAGYSQEAKHRCAHAVATAIARSVGVAVADADGETASATRRAEVTSAATLGARLRAACRLDELDAALRRVAASPEDARAAGFEALRAASPLREELRFGGELLGLEEALAGQRTR
jgi:erythronate-4-phosphate dehydrogenase